MDVDTEFRKILSGLTDTAADLKALEARIDERAKLNAIIKAYDMTKEQAGARIPTLLMATIEAARVG
jgi:methionine synthase I (cobalamin-dependent)